MRYIFSVMVVISFIGLATPCLADGKFIHLEGTDDCGDWLTERDTKSLRAAALQNYVLGELNGLALGANTAFWESDGRLISRNATYSLVDNYCRAHPAELLVIATIEVFKKRTGLTNDFWK